MSGGVCAVVIFVSVPDVESGAAVKPSWCVGDVFDLVTMVVDDGVEVDCDAVVLICAVSVVEAGPTVGLDGSGVSSMVVATASKAGAVGIAFLAAIASLSAMMASFSAICLSITALIISKTIPLQSP